MKQLLNIEGISRYPVKGLTAEHLDYIDVLEGRGFPMDRAYAITHGASKYDSLNGSWVPRRNFVVVAHSPDIVRLKTSLSVDQRQLIITLDEHVIGRLDTDRSNSVALNYILSGLNGSIQSGPYQLVKCAPDQTLTDHPTSSVSMMSISSLENLSKALGVPLEKERFRGNLWFTGGEEWEELDWIGREIRIGDALLKISEPIVRCSAVDVEPENEANDISVLKGLTRHFGHAHFGVLADIVHGGKISVGDEFVCKADLATTTDGAHRNERSQCSTVVRP